MDADNCRWDNGTAPGSSNQRRFAAAATSTASRRYSGQSHGHTSTVTLSVSSARSWGAYTCFRARRPQMSLSLRLRFRKIGHDDARGIRSLVGARDRGSVSPTNSPSPRHLTPLRADDFLRIVHDVTSWALTNFEAFRARPAAEELPHGISGTGSPYFGKASRLQPPFDSNTTVRTLSSVNDPALRCPALWWAHVLLAESHRCCNPTQMGLPARQWHMRRSRCPAGLHWLRDRMASWPAEYVRQHWTPIEPMLWPEKWDY